MQSYEDVINAVIKIVGDANGKITMESVFNQLGELPPSINGRELSFRLGKSVLEPYSKVGKWNWVLNNAGWKRYNEMIC